MQKHLKLSKHRRTERKGVGVLISMFTFLSLSLINLAYLHQTSKKLSEVENVVKDVHHISLKFEPNIETSPNSLNLSRGAIHTIIYAKVNQSQQAVSSSATLTAMADPSKKFDAPEQIASLPASFPKMLPLLENLSALISEDPIPTGRFRKFQWTYTFTDSNKLVLEQIHPDDAVDAVTHTRARAHARTYINTCTHFFHVIVDSNVI